MNNSHMSNLFENTYIQIPKVTVSLLHINFYSGASSGFNGQEF